jgi:hypothetical protein
LRQNQFKRAQRRYYARLGLNKRGGEKTGAVQSPRPTDQSHLLYPLPKCSRGGFVGSHSFFFFFAFNWITFKRRQYGFVGVLGHLRGEIKMEHLLAFPVQLISISSPLAKLFLGDFDFFR